MKKLVAVTVVGTLTLALLVQSAHALQLSFRPAAGTGQLAIAGFQAAGNLWATRLRDPITVVIDIDFRPLDAGVLGETASERSQVTYSEFRAALAKDKTSNDDNFLDVLRDHLAILLNRTSNSMFGSGNEKPYVDDNGDANNTTIQPTRANAKALRLLDADNPGSDASITFNSDFRWDFDPSDGIDPNSFSFIAVAAHEIGHALGFVSGVDILDGNSNPGGPFFADVQFAFVSPVDLVRISNESAAAGPGTIDWTADQRVKYFAPGAPMNMAGGFSTGVRWGDGHQASHWKDDLGLGLMDPTAAPGEHSSITTLDLKLFDLIGYDLAPGFTPDMPLTIAQLPPTPMPTAQALNIPVAAIGPGAATQRVQAAPEQPVFTFSARPEVPVLQLSYEGGMIKNPDTTPFVRVFGDGRVRVHYPAYHTKAGDYTLVLTPAEMNNLLKAFARNEVINANGLQLNTVPGANGQGGANAGPSLTNDHGVTAKVTIRVEATTPAGAALAIPMGERLLSLPKAALDPAARSRNSALTEVAGGIKELEALAQRPDLVKQQ